MCGKGVGNGLKYTKKKNLRTLLLFGHFWTNFGHVSQIPVLRFSCHCARRSIFGCRMTVLNFMQIVWIVFEKIKFFIETSEEKKVRVHK